MVCELKEIGSGKWLFVPKTLVDVFSLDLYEYKISIHGGKDIIFKNIGLLEDDVSKKEEIKDE